MSNLLSLPLDLMRTFYAFEAIRGTWSVTELKRQIESQYYQRCGWSRDPHKYAAMVQGKADRLNADDFIKTNNVLEFLGAKLPEGWEEDDLEQGICDNLKEFILEMGAGFCFEARQKKILIDDAYERIDLVFYHRILKCHVLIELKPKKFNRADAVQLGVYMEYYRKRVMTEGDNPPIGILMCTEVGKEIAEYIAPFIDERLFLSKYMLQLPSKETLTGFLRKENEGLQASVGKGVVKIAGKKSAKTRKIGSRKV
jgi:predicted nuclease of restriction endonuclease-like (RecB) superfamily